MSTAPSTPFDNHAIMSHRVAYWSCNCTSECVVLGTASCSITADAVHFRMRQRRFYVGWLVKIFSTGLTTTYKPFLPENVIWCVACQCLRFYDVAVNITDVWHNIMDVEGTCRGLRGVNTAAVRDCRKQHNSVQLVSQPRFEPRTFPMQVCSITTTPPCSLRCAFSVTWLFKPNVTLMKHWFSIKLK